MTPIPDSSIVALSRAVSELGSHQAPVHLTPVTRAYFTALAAATQDRAWARAISMLLKARDQRTRERAARLVVSQSTYPYLHSALLRTTAAYVIEEAGYKENVIPSSSACTATTSGSGSTHSLGVRSSCTASSRGSPTCDPAARTSPARGVRAHVGHPPASPRSPEISYGRDMTHALPQEAHHGR